MDFIRSAYKKIASLLLCGFSVIGLATGVRGLMAGRHGRVALIGGADSPTAILVSEEDAPFKTLLNFIATWSAIIAAISTLLLALIKKYVED